MNNKSIKVQSPGRVNIIGEHTDYTQGLVLPAAIDKKTTFILCENGTTSTVNVAATNVGEKFSFDLSSFAPLVKNGWQNYIMGVVHEILALKLNSPNINTQNIKGFDATFEGNVPIGGGLSSSASLECSLAFGINKLFDIGLDQWQIIKACQLAEHNFVGIKCGIMDQFASVKGRKDQVIFLDCRSLEYKYFPLHLEQYQLLLLNTNVSHALASSEYNTRRSECEEGLDIIMKSNPDDSITSLRDATIEVLNHTKKNLPPIIFNRCHHIITENQRVLNACDALVNKNFKRLGELIYQSHYSLSLDFEVSCPELDFLVDQTKEKTFILGSRMMGGGFGGCTISLIENDHISKFIDQTSRKYKSQFGIDLTPYQITIESGSGLVN